MASSCTALFRLFEQALGLVEETRVFKGNTHRIGQGRQQPLIIFVIGVFQITLHTDHARTVTIDYYGHRDN